MMTILQWLSPQLCFQVWFCMGMFLKHVVDSIPEMANMSHSVSLSK